MKNINFVGDNMSTRKISLIVVSAVMVLTAGIPAVADETYSGGVTVDIDRDVMGFLWVEDATVNLLENAHIRTADYYGDVYAVSGSVLNIYGGLIDGYLYVTTSYNGMPEAQVTIYGSNFAVDGIPVAQGTPEVFLENNQLSGVYQNGTAFSHWVSCFWEGDFYRTVKLGWINSKPEMMVTPQSLDFGQVKVGQSVTQMITITNTGNANLSLQSVAMADDSNPEFSFTPLAQLPMTVEPNQLVSLEVIFSPTMEGQALGVLKITGDDADTPFTDVVLTGVGIVPEIAMEPASMDFGQIDIGTSAALSMTIANHGDAQLVIQSIAWAAGGNADFAVAVLPELPLVIEPNCFVELSIVYTPTTLGAAAATLEIASDDLDQPMMSLAVAGVGVYPPLRQINDMIAFYDESVQNGTIQGIGPGRSAQAHVRAIRNVLLCTKFLIQSGYERYATVVLAEIDKLTDGQPRPKDLIVGSAVAELNAKIDMLITTLKTQ
jgi:hypothetical protein